MNTKITLLLLVLFACTRLVIAQDYAFRVLANNGQNKLKSSGNKWAVLKTGTKLQEGDKLKITTDGYLGLVHSSGKTLELKEAGTFDVSTLSDKIGSSSKSIVSKYADFVISKMSPEVIEENRKKYASVTGSGERGVISSDILLYLPKTAFLFNNEAVIRWRYTEKERTYLITFKDISGEQIFQDESNVPFYKIDFRNNRFSTAMVKNLYIVHITLKGNENVESQKVLIKLLDESENSQLITEVADLKNSLGSESALNNLIMADYFEANDLPLDAITQYERAINISPSVKYFQEVYDEYLIRSVVKYFSQPEEE